MEKPKIIVTEGWLECVEIHEKAGESDFKEALLRKQYPTEKSFYNGTWYWSFDEKGKLRGQSGAQAFTSMLRLNPNPQVMFAKEYIDGK